MTKFWLHVNHPNDKARIHIEVGCHWVRQALQRKHQGKAYGSIRGDKNGYWDGPFLNLQATQKAQVATGKGIQDKCNFCFQRRKAL